MTKCNKGIGMAGAVLYCSFVRHKTMHCPYEGHRESPYLAKLEADRQAQHSGYGIRQYHCSDGTICWEAYGWERITELQLHTTSYGLFDHKWEAEQYFNNVTNG